MPRKPTSVRATLCRMVKENPVRTVVALSNELGISRARIYEILRQEGLSVYGSRTLEPRIVTSGIIGPINATISGTVAELLAAADLMSRGYIVYYPLVRNSKIDLIVTSIKDHRVLRIEVRSGHRNALSEIKYARKPVDVCDHYAVVITGEPIVYEPELPDV